MSKSINRIDSIEWINQSNLPQISSPKLPKFYLQLFSTEDSYVADVYFVNNSDIILPMVIKDWLEVSEYQELVKDSDKAIEGLKYYREVKPRQGVKIGSQHIIYDSDGLSQYLISVMMPNHMVYKFNYLYNGTLSRTVVLMWEDKRVPSGVILKKVEINN